MEGSFEHRGNLPPLEDSWLERAAVRFDLRGEPRLIGVGTTCRVYACAVGEENKPCALKVLYVRNAPNGERRICEEIMANLALLGCENVVRLLDCAVNSENGEAFLLEELCQPLHEYRREHPLRAPEIFRLGMQICDALEQCQERGVAHLDVQPRNIFRAEDGRFKLGDFSCALPLSKLKEAHELRGTLAFMAPEVYSRREYGIRADLYSLALVLYCLLNGNRLPFVDEFGAEEGIQLRLDGAKLPPARDAGQSFNAQLSNALAPDPEARFANPEKMRAWLRDCLTEALEQDVALSEHSESGGEFDTDSSGATVPQREFDADEFASTQLPRNFFAAHSAARPRQPAQGPSAVPDFDDASIARSMAELPQELPEISFADTIAASCLPDVFICSDVSSSMPGGARDFDADPFAKSVRQPSALPDSVAESLEELLQDLAEEDAAPSRSSEGSSTSHPRKSKDAASSNARRHHFPFNAISALASSLSISSAPFEPLGLFGSGLTSLGDKLRARQQRKNEAKDSAAPAPDLASGMNPPSERAASSEPAAEAQSIQHPADQPVSSPAAKPIPPAAQPTSSAGAQPVQFSVVAPKQFQRDAYTMLDVFMYEEAARAVVDRALAEGDMAESRSGRLMAAMGTQVRVVLASPDLELSDCEESGVWAGDHLRFSFAVQLPADYAKSQILFNASIYFDGVLVTRLKFIANCASAAEQRPEVLRQDIRSAFISYSSHDRNQVASVVQGMQKVRPDMDIFWDLDRLHSGDYWDSIIKSEIDARDVLYLCWSHFARESKHVEDEWRYALERKGINFIEPIPFEPSELCPPPAELSSRHFNDRLLYFTLRQAGE